LHAKYTKAKHFNANSFTKDLEEGDKTVEEVSTSIRVLRVLKKVMGVVKQRMGCHFKDMNLTGPQGMLIGTLAHYGEMKVSDLSEKLGLSNSTVSGIIDRLENQDMVERIRSKEDRRVVYVKVTEKCRKDSQEHFEEINRMFEEMMDKATPDELNIILQGLDMLEKVIERRTE
jgi:MarR family transcriptional regulator, organic hydroperoxide resistance regulator